MSLAKDVTIGWLLENAYRGDQRRFRTTLLYLFKDKGWDFIEAADFDEVVGFCQVQKLRNIGPGALKALAKTLRDAGYSGWWDKYQNWSKRGPKKSMIEYRRALIQQMIQTAKRDIKKLEAKISALQLETLVLAESAATPNREKCAHGVLGKGASLIALLWFLVGCTPPRGDGYLCPENINPGPTGLSLGLKQKMRERMIERGECVRR